MELAIPGVAFPESWVSNQLLDFEVTWGTRDCTGGLRFIVLMRLVTNNQKYYVSSSPLSREGHSLDLKVRKLGLKET